MRTHRVEEIQIGHLAKYLNDAHAEGRTILTVLDGEPARRHWVHVISYVDTVPEPTVLPVLAAAAPSANARVFRPLNADLLADGRGKKRTRARK